VLALERQTNNVAEYCGLIIGLEVGYDSAFKHLPGDVPGLGQAATLCARQCARQKMPGGCATALMAALKGAAARRSPSREHHGRLSLLQCIRM